MHVGAPTSGRKNKIEKTEKGGFRMYATGWGVPFVFWCICRPAGIISIPTSIFGGRRAQRSSFWRLSGRARTSSTGQWGTQLVRSFLRQVVTLWAKPTFACAEQLKPRCTPRVICSPSPSHASPLPFLVDMPIPLHGCLHGLCACWRVRAL